MNGPVALAYPYVRTNAPNQQLFPPLGIASLAGELKALGVDARQHDCTFSTIEDVAEDIARQGAAIVGIYIMVTMSRPAFRLLDKIEEAAPNALTVAGGPLPTLYPERFAGRFDLVFRGETDLSFPSFCREYLALPEGADLERSLDLSSYPGLCRSRDGTFINNPQPSLSQEEFDALPIPDRSGADHRSYQEFWRGKMGGRMATLMTTRGCPHDCDFCSKPVFGNNFRKRSIEKVMEEVRDIARRGYDHIWIADDSFTLDLEHVEAFCEAMDSSGLDMRWSCLSRVDSIDRNVVGLMRGSGCVKVYLGLESGSDATLQLMNKRATVENGIRAVHLFREGGIKVGAFFLVGYPGETVDSIESTFSLALSLPLDEISFNVPYPLPGSALFSRVELLAPEDDWDIENDVRYLYRSEFDEHWLKRRITQTMSEFAMRSKESSGISSPCGIPYPANNR
jgi:anaerobic magnesium-protoporphyrin IX monomethyl ester cyclase